MLVNKRATTTTVSCSPAVIQINGTINCTATVTDVETAGTKTPPSGTVTFTFLNTLTNTSTTQTCTLPLTPTGPPDKNACTVSFTSSGSSVFRVTAAYGGSDVHGPSDSAAEPVFIVFYDPTGGFVTGGGWIMSPPGACTGLPASFKCDPTLVGKATFGFVSKYQKGANVPTGNTEFQFHAAGLNFMSSSYDWLVVTGAGASKAQYKGSGTINGSGSYGFMLTVIDGDNLNPKQPDKFRIKIWDKGTGNVVYDNQTGDVADGADPSTVISSGSIVIHK